MNVLRATSLYQSFRDITNAGEGSGTHCEKRSIAFGVKQHLPLGRQRVLWGHLAAASGTAGL